VLREFAVLWNSIFFYLIDQNAAEFAFFTSNQTELASSVCMVRSVGINSQHIHVYLSINQTEKNKPIGWQLWQMHCSGCIKLPH
jgi:hypothetical protein